MVKNRCGEISFELVRILLFVLLLVVMTVVVVILFKGKAGSLLESIMKILRFGR